MNKNYQIADISPSCIFEINELQDKLREQTKEDIILIAYEAVKEVDSSLFQISNRNAVYAATRK